VCVCVCVCVCVRERMNIAFFVLFLFSNSIQDVVMSRSSSASSPKQFVKANERYSEELVLIASCTNAVECKEILITALFEFAIDDVEMTKRDTLTAPKGLTEIARESDAELVSIAFARGRWSENARGARAFNFERESQQGAHLNARWNKEECVYASERAYLEKWERLMRGVGAQLCAGVRSESAKSYRARARFGSKWQSRDEVKNAMVMFKSMPKEYACVENLQSFFRQLPCGKHKGVASLIGGNNGRLIADAKYLSFGVSYEKRRRHKKNKASNNNNSSNTNNSTSATLSLSMTALMDKKVFMNMLKDWSVSSCAAAKDISRIYKLGDHEDDDVRVVDLRKWKRKKKKNLNEDDDFNVLAAELNLLDSTEIDNENTSSLIVGDLPSVTITRAVLGSGNIRGAISISITTNAAACFEKNRGDTLVRIFHPIPDYIRVFQHTFKVIASSSPRGDNESIVKSISWGEGLLEATLIIPSETDSVTLKFDFEKIFLPLESFEADAERGMTFPPAIAFSELNPGSYAMLNNNNDNDKKDTKSDRFKIAHQKLLLLLLQEQETTPTTTASSSRSSPIFSKLLEREQNEAIAHFLDAMTVILPVPDGAMPFNATAMACVAIVVHLGCLSKILTKRSSFEDRLARIARVETNAKKMTKKMKKKKINTTSTKLSTKSD